MLNPIDCDVHLDLVFLCQLFNSIDASVNDNKRMHSMLHFYQKGFNFESLAFFFTKHYITYYDYVFKHHLIMVPVILFQRLPYVPTPHSLSWSCVGVALVRT